MIVTLAAALSCGAPRSPVNAPSEVARCAPALDGAELFAREGLEGTFVLRDESTGCSRATDPAMADRGFRPESTFKIPNALIGLETGVIEVEHHLWRWDGAPRRLKDWEQDLELGGALKFSCVPCFQDVARRVGEARMKRWLRDASYGNQDIGGPIDQFWLDGPLRITPREQTEFVHRTLAGALPVKPEHVALVWRLLEIERGPGWEWHGKTGLGAMDGRAIGWLVGWVERDGRRYAYATFVRGRDGADADAEMARITPLRKPITRALLARSALVP